MTLPLLPGAGSDSANFNFDVIARQFPLGQENLALALLQTLFQPGDLKLTAVATAPSGWLVCDGTSYLRADYPALFAAIGGAFGAVDGTHFNVPDYRGRVPVGVGAHADVDTLGDNDGLANASRTPKTPAVNVGKEILDGDLVIVKPYPVNAKAGVDLAFVEHKYYEDHVHEVPATQTPYQTAYFLIKT